MCQEGPNNILDYYIKSTPEEIQDRVCLTCQKTFKSKHKFNRMCSNCKESTRSMPFKSGLSLNIVETSYFF